MSEQRVDAVIVGAGFAGMYALHRLLKENFRPIVFEIGDNVGGTWYWNRYPGARCDVQSMEYSYTFDDALQQDWNWSEKYAPQPEILCYANHVADRFKLRPHINFSTRVLSAHYQQDDQEWLVKTDKNKVYRAKFCIMGTGCLSSTNLPKFKDMDQFRGESFHTGNWPHGPVDFNSKRIGIIGTGSSAIQSIPLIAESCEHLTVFQRTANFSIPAHNRPLDKQYAASIKESYPTFRAENRQMFAAFGSHQSRWDDSIFDVDDHTRQVRFEKKWQEGGLGFTSAFGDTGASKQANDIAADFVRNKIRTIVKDSEVAELLCPDQVLGCKRVCVDSHYFETYNRANVQLVNVKEHPIEAITAEGLIHKGQHYQFDMIIYATGFDAMTGSLLKIDITGKNVLSLQDKWLAGPRTYLGLCTHGFPNFFTVSGPGSPSVLSNMIITIEQHVNWIIDCMTHLRDNNLSTIEALEEAENDWVTQTNEIANGTLFPTCNSWYLGANVPGKPRIFMPFAGGFPAYAKICSEVAEQHYRGFELSA